MIGKTVSVEPHGSIVILWVEAPIAHGSSATQGPVTPVYFDRRMFEHLWEGRGAGRILEQDVEVIETPEGNVVRFLDDDDEPLQFDSKPGAHDGFPF